MLFLVDGYNVTMGDPATAGLSLEAQRDELVARLRARGEQVLGRGSIIVVFDGEIGVAPGGLPRSATHPVEVVYSRGVTADDAIVQRASRERGQVCLVSSDRGLADRVRAAHGRGTEVRPRESVYDAAVGRTRPRQRGPEREVGLPPGSNKITEELKGLWLEEEETEEE